MTETETETEASRPLRLLFVCTGNLCRSPMAAGLAGAMAEERGLDVEVRSCGTIGQDGFPASENAVIALQELGIDIADHRSQPLTRELVEWADHVLVMEESHVLAVNARDWRAPFKTWSLGSFIGEKQIKDPYKRSLRRYRKTRDILRKAVDEALERLVV